MKNKYQVYINAAKRIGEGLERYSCHAVNKASGKHTCLDYCKEKESYMRVFTETKDDIAFHGYKSPSSKSSQATLARLSNKMRRPKGSSSSSIDLRKASWPRSSLLFPSV